MKTKRRTGELHSLICFCTNIWNHIT